MKTAKIERFRREDMELLEIQPRHAAVKEEFLERPEEFAHQIEKSYAWTIWSAHGIPLVIGGVTPQGWGWAFLAADLRRHMVAVSRLVRRVLTHAEAPVFAEIDETWREGVRWATLLGFRRVRPGVWMFE